MFIAMHEICKPIAILYRYSGAFQCQIAPKLIAEFGRTHCTFLHALILPVKAGEPTLVPTLFSGAAYWFLKECILGVNDV